jgi:hypothetical protein
VADEPDSKEEKGEDLIITPGGARPRRLVRQVRPGEAVHFDEEGEATIVRQGEDTSSEKEEGH